MGGYSAGLPKPSSTGGSWEGLVIPGNTSAADTSFTVYGTAASVLTGVETTVVSYLVPLSGVFHLIRAEFGGMNLATYRLYYGPTEKDQFITYWTGGPNGRWDYTIPGAAGVALPNGTLITIKVLHQRPYAADFYGKFVLININ